jgi:hypothetical protein
MPPAKTLTRCGNNWPTRQASIHVQNGDGNYGLSIKNHGMQ